MCVRDDGSDRDESSLGSSSGDCGVEAGLGARDYPDMSEDIADAEPSGDEDVVEAFDGGSGNIDPSEGDVLFDPAFREKFIDIMTEARKKNMDLVLFPNGGIMYMANKIATYSYVWHKRKRDFKRVQGNGTKGSCRQSVPRTKDVVSESGYQNHVDAVSTSNSMGVVDGANFRHERTRKEELVD